MKTNFNVRSVAFYMAALAGATALLVSCSEDETLSNKSADRKNLVTLTAQIAGQPSTRLVYDETNTTEGEKTKVKWAAAGEQFSLLYSGAANASYIFTKEGSEEIASASFTCNSAPADDLSGTTLYAVYPGSSEYKANATSVTLDLSNQSGTLADVQNKYDFMVASTTGTNNEWDNVNFRFEHKVAIVKLTMKNDAFKGQSVSNIGFLATGLTSRATYTLHDDSWAPANGSIPQVITTESVIGSADEGSVTIYLSIFPGSLTGCKTVAICEGKLYEAALSDIELSAGNIYRATVNATVSDKFVVQAENGRYYNGLSMDIGTWEANSATQKTLGTATVIGNSAFFENNILDGYSDKNIWICFPKVVKYFHTLTADEANHKTLTLPDKDAGSTLKPSPVAGDKAYENDWIVALYININKDGSTDSNATPIYWATGNLIATKTNEAGASTTAAFHIATADETKAEGTCTTPQDSYNSGVPASASSSDGYSSCSVGSQWNMFGWGDTTGLKTSKIEDDYASGVTQNGESICGNDVYDIARKQLGGSWRLPTNVQNTTASELAAFADDDYSALLPDGTDWKVNGVYLGRTYAYPIENIGSTGITITNTLSFPAAGSYYGADVFDRGNYGCYWSGLSGGSGYARGFDFYSDFAYLNGSNRSDRRPVRPVSE